MIVPEFWAEARIRTREGGRQVTVRRFGWSDESDAAARTHAEQRAREAIEQIFAGEQVARAEPRRPYNGAEGVPIREEIVSRHGDTVVTRNAYGALCLNTPNVLFADLDFDAGRNPILSFSVHLLFIVAALAYAWTRQSWGAALVGAGVATGLAVITVNLMRVLGSRLSGGPEARARRRIDAFLDGNRDWHVRIYRTPAGLRVMALHRTFDTSDPEVADCFSALGTDPIYARMCFRQRCFRARLTPKPWRIGIAPHMPPRPGVWPVAPDRLPARTRWVETYELAAGSHAACQYVEAAGSGLVHPAARDVMALHDELAKANSGLPIA